jgi:hypothetical protein
MQQQELHIYARHAIDHHRYHSIVGYVRQGQAMYVCASMHAMLTKWLHTSSSYES